MKSVFAAAIVAVTATSAFAVDPTGMGANAMGNTNGANQEAADAAFSVILGNVFDYQDAMGITDYSVAKQVIGTLANDSDFFNGGTIQQFYEDNLKDLPAPDQAFSGPTGEMIGFSPAN